MQTKAGLTQQLSEKSGINQTDIGDWKTVRQIHCFRRLSD